MVPLDLCDKNSMLPPSSKRPPWAGVSKHSLQGNAAKSPTDIRQSRYWPNGMHLLLQFLLFRTPLNKFLNRLEFRLVALFKTFAIMYHKEIVLFWKMFKIDVCFPCAIAGGWLQHQISTNPAEIRQRISATHYVDSKSFVDETCFTNTRLRWERESDHREFRKARDHLAYQQNSKAKGRVNLLPFAISGCNTDRGHILWISSVVGTRVDSLPLDELS